MYRNKIYAFAAVSTLFVVGTQTWFSPFSRGMGPFVRAYVGVVYLVCIVLAIALWRRAWPFAGRYVERSVVATVAVLGMAYVFIATLIVVSIGG